MPYININGNITPAEHPVLKAGNRSFKYGDGLFETMRMSEEKIMLADYHFERLFNSLQLLQINSSQIERNKIEQEIISLSQKNNCHQSARVRLHLWRNDIGDAEYLIECSALDSNYSEWHKKFVIDIYPYALKATDAFANIKSANYLPYVMADLHAKSNELNECIVLNHYRNICDASKANIFIISNNEIITPALHQGCVNGVMRRNIIDQLKKQGTVVRQKEITPENLEEAEEVFLTNALTGIRPVTHFRNITYQTKQTEDIYSRLLGKHPFYNS